MSPPRGDDAGARVAHLERLVAQHAVAPDPDSIRIRRPRNAMNARIREQESTGQHVEPEQHGLRKNVGRRFGG